MLQTTSCFLLQGEPPTHILLGFKKTGFGAGKFTGIGGKVEPGETPAQAALREVQEETGLTVKPSTLRGFGRLDFAFRDKPELNLSVHVFTLSGWEGEPHEGREIVPEWFPVGKIPYVQMWQDAAMWLPSVLAGKPVNLNILYAADGANVLVAVNRDSEALD